MRKNNPWLIDHLIEQGYITAGRIGRKAQRRRCKKCGASIITALDADMCALLAECDPQPIDNFGEVAALTDGRWTYRLDFGRLDKRSLIQIRATPANTITVLQSHRCTGNETK
jgi:hypothetical protein